MTLNLFRQILARRNQADDRDFYAMRAFLRMPLTPYARRMMLSGLAGFNRTP